MKHAYLAKIPATIVLIILFFICGSALAASLPEAYLSGTRTWTSPFPYYVSSSMEVTFTDASELHPDDTVCISNVIENGELKESYILNGDQIAGKTVRVFGTELTIQASTSYGGKYIGYQVEKIECVAKSGRSAIFNRDKTYDIVINGSGWNDSLLISLRDYKPDDYELGKLVISKGFTCGFTGDLGMPEYENRGMITSGTFANSIVYNYGTISGGTFDDVSNESTGVISGGTFNGTLYNGGSLDSDACTINGSVAEGSLPDASDFRYTDYVSTVTITGYSGTNTDVVIPSKIKGKLVTELGESIFYRNNSITSVIIPDSVTSIGKNAFKDCTNLTSVTLPENLTSIKSFTFKGCSRLKDIVIPNGVTYIDNEAFYGCTSLTGVTLPESLTDFGYSVFFNCSSLASIAIPNGVSQIERDVFHFCNALASVSLPQNLESIGDNAFSGCSKLSDITIPESVTYIGSYAFSNCTRLYSIAVPEKVTSISGIFYGCSGLSSVSLPHNLKQIGDDTFNGCSSLTGITIPSTVTSIGSHAFYNCRAIQNIVLPEGITSIGEYAFCFCDNLRSITIPHTATDLGFLFIFYSDFGPVVYCHEDSPAHAYVLEENASSATDFVLRVEHHTYKVVGGMEPGCENEGYTNYSCTVCGYEYTEYQYPLEHDYQVSDSKAPNCDEPGYTTYICSLCKGTYTENYESLGHDHQVSASKEPDCDELGFTTYTCIRCGDTYTTNHWQLGHSYINGICIRCGEYKPVPSLPDGFHQEVLNTGHVVSLPRGSYLDTERSTSTMEYWVTPSKLVVVFAKQKMYAPVQNWATAGKNMYNTQYTIFNEVPVAFGTHYDSSKAVYTGACYFNSGGYSYAVMSDLMTNSQRISFESICKTIYNGTVPEKKPFKQEILGSGITVYLPGDAYLYSTDADGNQYWSSPKQNLMIGFSKNQLAPLEAWKAVCENDFVYCEIETIGNARVLVCDDVDENERCISHCYVNGLDATYSITSLDMTIDQYAWFQVNVTNTIQVNFDAGSVMVLPSALKEIHQEAFAFCNAQIVMIPDGCEIISTKAFYGSNSLKRIDIPASVTTIYPDAFDGCDNLTIYAPAGSKAIEFAKIWDINYIQQ